MNIPKAIEILENDVSPPELRFTTDYCLAVKLATEALKQTQEDRDGNPLLDGELLPGETDE